MIPIIVILSISIIILILEVFHDDVHRLIRNKGRAMMIKFETATWDSRPPYTASDDIGQDDNWSDEWHTINLFMWVLSGALITFLMIWFTEDWFNLLIISMLATERVLILNIGGNKLARRKILYLGNGKWDKLFRGNEKLYYFVVMAVFIASTYFLIWNAT